MKIISDVHLGLYRSIPKKKTEKQNSCTFFHINTEHNLYEKVSSADFYGEQREKANINKKRKQKSTKKKATTTNKQNTHR